MCLIWKKWVSFDWIFDWSFNFALIACYIWLEWRCFVYLLSIKTWCLTQLWRLLGNIYLDFIFLFCHQTWKRISKSIIRWDERIRCRQAILLLEWIINWVGIFARALPKNLFIWYANIDWRRHQEWLLWCMFWEMRFSLISFSAFFCFIVC